MDKQTAISKIKKCLALSKSVNEHEAAAAVRQAQALMREHGVSDADVLVSDVSECDARAGASTRPASWEAGLVSVIGRAFGCQVIFSPTFTAGKWTFIGALAAPDIAQYAFTVLKRQLAKERRAFIHGHCKRLKPANKTRRADLFCDAWVAAVSRMVSNFAADADTERAVSLYVERHHRNLEVLNPVERNDGRSFDNKDLVAIVAGSASGRQAKLHHGVGAADAPLTLR